MTSNFASKYNHKGSYKYHAPKEADYINLRDMFKRDGKEATHTVKALYINTKSKFGDAPVAVTITENKDKQQVDLVNLPSFMLSTVKDMIQDDDLTEAIDNGEFGFTIYEYEGKNGYGFSAEWVDVEPLPF